MYLSSPAHFAGTDDIITNLAKEREPGIEIIERTSLSLIITSLDAGAERSEIKQYFFSKLEF